MATKKRTFRKTKDNQLDPSVTTAGMVVRVEKFKFRIGGVNYEFLENEEVTLEADKEVVTGICGFLVLDEKKKVRVLVDEVLHNGIDAPYRWKDSPLTYLTHLFDITLPPRTTDLEKVDVKVYQYVSIDEEEN